MNKIKNVHNYTDFAIAFACSSFAAIFNKSSTIVGIEKFLYMMIIGGIIYFVGKTYISKLVLYIALKVIKESKLTGMWIEITKDSEGNIYYGLFEIKYSGEKDMYVVNGECYTHDGCVYATWESTRLDISLESKKIEYTYTSQIGSTDIKGYACLKIHAVGNKYTEGSGYLIDMLNPDTTKISKSMNFNVLKIDKDLCLKINNSENIINKYEFVNKFSEYANKNLKYILNIKA
jgi:hypothetical protein